MIKRIKGWFTNKNKQLELDKTSNINSIGVARNVDLKKIIDRITQIENTLNNLPPPTTPPDLTPYALKNTNNEFTESQSIKNDAAFWEFKNSAGRRVGYVGKPSSNSNNIGLVNENGDTLVKATGDVKLEVGARNGVIGERAPTANNHLTNKKYVDDKIRQEIDAIPPLDLSDFASLTQDNQFTGNNQFNNGVNFQNATNLNGDAKYFGNVTENKHIATKEYVDSNSQNSNFAVWKPFENISMNKTGNIYRLYRNDFTFDDETNRKLGNDSWSVNIMLKSIKTNQGVEFFNIPLGEYQVLSNKSVIIADTFFPLQYTFANDGNFTATCRFFFFFKKCDVSGLNFYNEENKLCESFD